MSTDKSKSISQAGASSSVDPQCEERFLDNILSQGDSYEALKNSLSGGVHFQFKLEKAWTLADVPINSRFRIQISLMSENFVKIPFSERRKMYSRYCSLQKIAASSDQHSPGSPVSVDVSSDESKENWSTVISKRLGELDQEWVDNVHNTAENRVLPIVPSTVTAEECTNSDASMSESHSNRVLKNFSHPVKLKGSKTPNLEDWLDSILDD